MKNLWGRYPWCELDGIDKIHPDDLENFKNEANNVKVFECVSENTEFITLKYGEKLFRVKNDLFKVVPMPKFHTGQKLRLVGKSEEDVVISDVMWHFEKHEHYYFITVAGKKKSKRYSESEFTA